MGNSPENRDTFHVVDATYSADKALPTVGASAYSVGYDLHALTGKGARLADMEFEVSHPALTNAQMKDTDTMKISVVSDAALPIDGSSVVIAADAISSLGAGGAGCAAAVAKFKIPSNCSRYIGVKATHVGTGAPQTADMTTRLLF